MRRLQHFTSAPGVSAWAGVAPEAAGLTPRRLAGRSAEGFRVHEASRLAGAGPLPARCGFDGCGSAAERSADGSRLAAAAPLPLRSGCGTCASAAGCACRLGLGVSHISHLSALACVQQRLQLQETPDMFIIATFDI